MEELTILVNSCDLYEDAWEPFFRLLKIQWPQCANYRIVLNTETKEYFCDFLQVDTICGGANIPWAKRLKNVLSKIETEFIVYFLEDFFLMSPVSVKSFEKAMNLIRNDNSIGYIGLKYNKDHIFKDEKKRDLSQPFFNKDDLVKANRVNSMTALWRKSWLQSLIRSHETPWEFEIYASKRSKRSEMRVLIINNSVMDPVFNYEVDLHYGYGISMRKWLPNNKELFEKYGIKVNYDRLGVLDLEKTLNPVNVGEGQKGLIERLYIIKKIVKRIPKNIKRTIRIIRSMI